MSDAPVTEIPPVTEILGIRHHGPGSARAVRLALDRLQPDVVLIEGPADATPLTSFVSGADLEPPVALLAYVADTPRLAAFWPFAVFSPEWQALRWAARHRVPVRFCDLPSGSMLARHQGAGDQAEEQEDEEPDEPEDEQRTRLRGDPIAVLAQAAGYDDPERWWDDVVEIRLDLPTPFEAITAAMAELRQHAPRAGAREQLKEDRREAFMRQTMRAALKDGAQRMAVVCGAWHAPALTSTLNNALPGKPPTAASDARVLKGMPKRRTAITWVPWTASRLSYASGYGAGVESPGWYHHLFTTTDVEHGGSQDQVVTRWLTKVARVLRTEDLAVSSAHVIEGVRLAEALAGMRGRPLAGLDEVTEATRAVLCDGDEARLALVTGRLVVGEAMGAVPDTVPAVPLETDLKATARRLRLKAEPLQRTLELDLRKENDRARSHLLHRLTFLGVPWGTETDSVTGTTGTFRETWSLRWRPELTVSVVEASIWGSTVVTAAAAKAVDAGTNAGLPELTLLVERVLLADLPDALAGLLRLLADRAARDLDVDHLMAALPPLARAQRYSDVRGTDSAQLGLVADAMLIRICAGLPAAVTGLDDDAARTLRARLDAVHDAVQLRDDASGRDRWMTTLAAISERTDVAGVLTGRITRLLRDAARISTGEASDRLARALSVGTPATAKAGWVEGFLDGGGLILVHDHDLLTLIDEWLAGLGDDDFTAVLPLLRRTFGGFPEPERRALGEATRRRPGARTRSTGHTGFDPELARPALATAARILFGTTPATTDVGTTPRTAFGGQP